MSSFNFLGKFGIVIISAILALILARIGISYLVILIAIGFIIALITKSKAYAVLTGLLYTVISYILSYPVGLFLVDYMPTTNVTIPIDTITVGIDLLMGVLIPAIAAVVLCGLPAIIGVNIAEYIHKPTTQPQKEEHHYKVMDNFNQVHKKVNKKQVEADILRQTPIQKAKNRKKKEKQKEDYKK